MHPFIEIGELKIPTYSVMIAIGVIFGLFYAYYAVYKAERISTFTAIRLFLCAAISAVFMVGGASFFDSLFHSIEEKKLVFGGITWLGGVVVSFPVCVFLIHKLVPVAKGRALYTFSLIIPAVVLAHGFGRIGCFFAGCCYGRETDSFLGVVFPGMEHAVLPTQLFEAAFEFILFTFMVIFRKKIKGHELELYLFVYAIFRFIIEFYRGDSRGSTAIFLTPAQLLDIVCIVAAVLIYLFHKNKVFKKMYAKCLVWQNSAKENAGRHRTIFEPSLSPQESIKELYDLKEAGIITEEEFELKKKELLKKI